MPAPLCFANAGIFADQVRELVEERQPAWVVLRCEAITDIDVTAAGMLDRLGQELNAKGVHLAFVELRTRLYGLVHDYGLSQPSTVTTSTRRSAKRWSTSPEPPAPSTWSRKRLTGSERLPKQASRAALPRHVNCFGNVHPTSVTGRSAHPTAMRPSIWLAGKQLGVHASWCKRGRGQHHLLRDPAPRTVASCAAEAP